MDLLLLFARLILAAVFIVAGITKLLDPSGSKKAFAEFGLPISITAPVSILLPLAELAIGLLLLPLATARWAAIGSIILLGAFIAAIAYNLARGRTPDCHCFGQVYSEPIGITTLLRNGALMIVAVFLLIAGWNNSGPSVVGWFADLSVAERIVATIAIVALIVAALEAWLLIHLIGQNGRLMLRMDTLETLQKTNTPVNSSAPVKDRQYLGLPVGTPAPSFRLNGLHGETISLDSLRMTDRPIMLVFVDPNCASCNVLLPELGKWQREYADTFDIVIISRGRPEANRAKMTEHGLTRVLLQQDREISLLYEAHGTPAATIIQPDGTIGAPLAGGNEAIRRLVHSLVSENTVQSTAAAQPSQPQSTIGSPAPVVILPDLSGKMSKLSDFIHKPTVILFWNPNCGFCKRMLNDLKAWETTPPAGAPQLVIISVGTIEANKTLGLTSPMLIGKDFSAGHAFGATGTPSAVLIDEQGNIASDIAAGAPAVLALVSGPPQKSAVKS